MQKSIKTLILGLFLMSGSFINTVPEQHKNTPVSTICLAGAGTLAIGAFIAFKMKQHSKIMLYHQLEREYKDMYQSYSCLEKIKKTRLASRIFFTGSVVLGCLGGMLRSSGK